MVDDIKIFTFLFLMLGPLKMLVPFAKITHGVEAKLIRQIAIRAFLFSCLAIMVAAFIGEAMLDKYGIPLPILALTGGIVLFLVALQGILHQFSPEHNDGNLPPSLQLALNPIAFPMIVTPYGIAAVIVFMALRPNIESKLSIGGMLLGIMVLNLVMMLLARKILIFKGAALRILGAVLGIVQAALGIQIINTALVQIKDQFY